MLAAGPALHQAQRKVSKRIIELLGADPTRLAVLKLIGDARAFLLITRNSSSAEFAFDIIVMIERLSRKRKSDATVMSTLRMRNGSTVSTTIPNSVQTFKFLN